MKRTSAFIIMAAALLLTQCRKPSIDFPTPSVTTTVNMTITAGPGSKTDITTAGGITWSAGDRLYVGDGAKYIGYLSIVSGVGDATGTFTGEVTATTGVDRTFHFYYLGSTAAPAANATEVTVDFSSQDIYEESGKLKNASGQHVGYGKVEGVDVAAGSPITGIQVDMKSRVAIAYFCFESGTGTPTPYTGALTLSGEHIYNKMTVNFNASDFSFTPVKDGDISLTNTTTHLKYVMLVPSGTATAETLNFSGGAAGSTTLANGIEANKFYRVDSSMPIVVTVKPAHETVNFGTPDLNWSKYNLGVDPEDLDAATDWYGWYFMWGSTTNGGDSNCSWANCPGNGGNSSYNADAFSTWRAANLTNDVLNSGVDAATVAWGDGWRMPTSAEWKALYDNNTFEWLAAGATSEKVAGFTAVAAGCLVIKGKDPSLDRTVYMFLPAAGKRDGSGLDDAGSDGLYWSSSLYTGIPNNAYYMLLNSGLVYPRNFDFRYYGFSVRPVR